MAALSRRRLGSIAGAIPAVLAGACRLGNNAVSIERQGGVNIPVSKKVAENVFLTAPSPFSNKKWLDAAASTKSDPAHPKWQPDLNAIYGKYTAQLRTGEASPREAMQTLRTTSMPCWTNTSGSAAGDQRC